MRNPEAYYVQGCKILIEQKLAWPDSSQWRQRDFLNLIDLLENESGISLSLSTIKRIWKPDYEGTPHPSTLDAFARFLDYKDWMEFKAHCPQATPEQTIVSSDKSQAQKKISFPKLLYPILIISLLSGITIILFPSNNIKTSSTISYHPEEVHFSTENSVSTGVPNTVLFHYDVSQVKADSFFIQQSWNRFRRDKVQAANHHLSSMYYLPGVHQAKLIANDSILKESTVKVYTQDWLALARYGYDDDVPTYIREKDVQKIGQLHVSENHLKHNRLEINQDLIVSYFYVDKLKKVSSSNFSFATRLMSDSLVNITCPHIGITILGEHDMNFIPLTLQGCVGNATIKFGDVTKAGSNEDLTSLGVDIYQWQDVKVDVINKEAHIWINDLKVMEIPFTEDIGEIVGFNINFSGSGIIDFLSLSSPEDTIYHTDFQ